MNLRKTTHAVLMLIALGTAGAASAASIISSTNTITAPIVVDFNNFDGLVTSGPVELGANPGDIVFTSGPNSVLGASAQDLDQNGLWGARGNPVDGLVATPTGSGNFLSTAFVARRGEVAFTFAAPTIEVGAFFNQFQGSGSNTLRLTAYDINGVEVESFNYAIDTDAFGYNEGVFLGFRRTTADIYGLGISDGTFVLDDLTVSAVPEPDSMALLACGLAILGWFGRRRIGA